MNKLVVVCIMLVTLLVECRSRTKVDIGWDQFHINGSPTNNGSRSEGLLLNCRMMQGVFDDENPSTVPLWKYPDTGRWVPSRNTDELVQNIQTYSLLGLNAISVGLQGSIPTNSIHSGWVVTAFGVDGSLKSAWMQRLQKVIAAADAQRMVVILNLFQLGQESHLAPGDTTILRAVENVVNWIGQQGFQNVILDLADECSPYFKHPILLPTGIYQLLRYVQALSTSVKVSTSFPPGVIPPDSVLQYADFVILHANGLNRTGLRVMLNELKANYAYQKHQTPILINQDSTYLENLEAAVIGNASWGYHEQGINNYRDGFQSPPVNWTVNTQTKRAFFDRVLLYTQPSERK